MCSSFALIVLFLLLAGCAVTEPPPADVPRASFVEGIDQLAPEEFLAARNEALERYARDPSDANRLRLSYILSRPNSPTQDLVTSRALLEEISAQSEVALLRDSMQREIELLAELKKARQDVAEQQARLEAVQQDLEKSERLKSELQSTRNRLDALQGEFADLRAQLAQLKSIEADLAGKRSDLDGEAR